MNSRRMPAMIGVASIALASCGTSDNAPVPASPVAITSANAPVIAGSVVGAALSSAGATGSGLVGLGGVVTPAGYQGGHSYAAAVRRTLAAVSTTRARIAAASGPIDCSVAGSVTLSGTIADATGTTLTPGDSVTGAFTACDDGEGTVLDGSLRIDVHAFTGDLATGLWVLDGKTTLTSFKITVDGVSDTADGQLDMHLDTTGDPIDAGTLSGAGFRIVDGGDTYVWDAMTTEITLDYGTTPVGYTENASGVIHGDTIGGQVSIETLVPLQGQGLGPPSSGELLVTGASATTVKIVAVDATNVQLLIDSTGDGTVDDTQNTTWAALGL